MTFLKFADFSLNIFIKCILVKKKEYSLRASLLISYFSTPSGEFAKKCLYWKISFGLVIFGRDRTERIDSILILSPLFFCPYFLTGTSIGILNLLLALLMKSTCYNAVLLDKDA